MTIAHALAHACGPGHRDPASGTSKLSAGVLLKAIVSGLVDGEGDQELCAAALTALSSAESESCVGSSRMVRTRPCGPTMSMKSLWTTS